MPARSANGWRRCDSASGWSMPSARSPVPRPSWPTSPAIPTGWRSRTVVWLQWMKRGVSFRWKDYRAKGRTRRKTMTLTADELMRRFLLHVLPPGFHRIRHYGLLANVGRQLYLASACLAGRTSTRAGRPRARHDVTTDLHLSLLRCHHAGRRGRHASSTDSRTTMRRSLQSSGRTSDSARSHSRRWVRPAVAHCASQRVRGAPGRPARAASEAPSVSMCVRIRASPGHLCQSSALSGTSAAVKSP